MVRLLHVKTLKSHSRKMILSQKMQQIFFFFLLEIEKLSIKCSPTYTLINGLNHFLNCLLFLHLLEIQVLFPVTGWGLHDDT